jgi:hypothetical protein
MTGDANSHLVIGFDEIKKLHGQLVYKLDQ